MNKTATCELENELFKSVFDKTTHLKIRDTMQPTSLFKNLCLKSASIGM